MPSKDLDQPEYLHSPIKHNVITLSVIMLCFMSKNVYSHKILFKSHITNRILHLWSFHMKFIKLPEDFLHMK